MTTGSTRPTPAAVLLDLLLPRTCGGCGHGPAGTGGWCPACAERTGGPIAVRVPGAPRVVAAGRYAGPLRRAVLSYKERGRRDLAPDLAALLVPVVAAVLPAEHARGDPAPVVLVPAPSRRGAARARGGDHVVRLCGALARRLDVVGLGASTAAVLALDRRAKDSVGLDAAARARNLATALRPAPGAHRSSGRPGRTAPDRPGPVLLVDDVVTTGATLRTCTDALTRLGLRPRGCVVLADATTYRGP